MNRIYHLNTIIHIYTSYITSVSKLGTVAKVLGTKVYMNY